MSRNEPVLIIGASARAASMSAVRAGLKPVASDLFGDRDLTKRASFHEISAYPEDFLEVARRFSSQYGKKLPLIYTGALENYPELLDKLEHYTHLFGNRGEVIRRIRDPFLISDLLKKWGFPTVPLKREFPSHEIQKNPRKKWLCKSVKSSGGNQVKFCDRESNWKLDPEKNDSEKNYFQQFVTGDSISATFLSTGNGLYLLGMTRQLTGVEEWNAKPFSYCGSIGPIRLNPRAEQQLLEIGENLDFHFKLKGLWGIDLIDDGESLWLLEINPRYTASVEVLEFAYGRSFLDWHWKCFEDDSSQKYLWNENPVSHLYLQDKVHSISKAILFSGSKFRFPQEIPLDLNMLEQVDFLDKNQLVIADVPQAGTFIEAGKPICSFLASSGNLNETMKNFQGELTSLIKQA